MKNINNIFYSKLKVKYLFFIGLLILASLPKPVLGQPEQQRKLISSEKWLEKSKSYDYSENYKSWKSKQKNKPRKNPNFRPFSFDMAGNVAKFIIWGLVLAALTTFLVLLFINLYKNSGEKVKTKDFKIDDPIENIDEADLEKLLGIALNEKLYREALRFKYLILLRALNQWKYIVWKKDKTNGTYLSEMRTNARFEMFKLLTISFERVWYGNKAFGEPDYNTLSPVFEQFQENVSSAITKKPDAVL